MLNHYGKKLTAISVFTSGGTTHERVGDVINEKYVLLSQLDENVDWGKDHGPVRSVTTVWLATTDIGLVRKIMKQEGRAKTVNEYNIEEKKLDISWSK